MGNSILSKLNIFKLIQVSINSIKEDKSQEKGKFLAGIIQNKHMTLFLLLLLEKEVATKGQRHRKGFVIDYFLRKINR